MAGSDGGSSGPGRRRFALVALVFGLGELAWNAWVVYQLMSGAEAVRPAIFFQIFLQVGVGLSLIALALQFRREPPAS